MHVIDTCRGGLSLFYQLYTRESDNEEFDDKRLPYAARSIDVLPVCVGVRW